VLDPSRRRIAITGLGAICALGQQVPEVWAAMQAGQCGIAPITGIQTNRLSAGIAAQVSGFDPAAHLGNRRAPTLDRGVQLAIVAAREAMQQAGLQPDPAQAHRRAVILAAVIGQTSLDAEYYRFYGEGATRAHPLTVPRIMTNGPASHLTMEFGMHGPSYAVASACASANHAIACAADAIRLGRSDVVLTGGPTLPSWRACSSAGRRCGCSAPTPAGRSPATARAWYSGKVRASWCWRAGTTLPGAAPLSWRNWLASA